MDVRLKRVYERPERGDGLRVLVSILVGIIVQFGLFMFAAMPLMLVGTTLGLDSGLGTTIFVLAYLTYPVLLIIRLVRIVRESNAYTHNHVLPTWGKARQKAS